MTLVVNLKACEAVEVASLIVLVATAPVQQHAILEELRILPMCS